MKTKHVTIKDIQIDWKLYPEIVKFLVSGQDPSTIDTLHLVKLEIAERLAQKVPQLRHDYYKEAFLLAVEMKFAAIERAFARKESERVQSEELAEDKRKEAVCTLRSFGLFANELDDLHF